MLIERWIINAPQKMWDETSLTTYTFWLFVLISDLWPSGAPPVCGGRHVSDESGVAGLPATGDRQRPGHVFRVQGGHLVCWGHAVSSSRHASCWWWDTLTAGAGGRSQNSGSGQSRRSMFRPRPHNPALSIEFVLREAAALSFLTYNQKQNNA